MKMLLTVAGAALALAGTAAFADPIPQSSDAFSVYAKDADWTIYADASTKTCLGERVGPEGNVIQMGMTQDKGEAYIGVFTKADIGIQDDQPIEIGVDGTIFTGTSRGIVSGELKDGYHGGYVVTNNPDFVNAVANGKELVAFPEKTGVFMVNLDGTKKAIEQIEACNKAQ